MANPASIPPSWLEAIEALVSEHEAAGAPTLPETTRLLQLVFGGGHAPAAGAAAGLPTTERDRAIEYYLDRSARRPR